MTDPSGPPGPFRRSFWRSPIRGPWLTSVFGLLLLASIPVMFATGLLSYAAYNPDLSPVNDTTPGKGLLGFYLFSWPTHPVWLYRLNQGVHVTLGLMLVPILLFKLWSVLPKLFEWPPLRSPAHALERLSLFLLVGGAVFEFATGILNIQTWYKFPGSFYPLHFYGAWVFIAGFVVHVTAQAAGHDQGAAQPQLDRGDCARTSPGRARSRRTPGTWPPWRPPLRRSPGAACWPSPARARPSSRCCRWASPWAARCGGPRCSRRTARTSAAGTAAISRSTRPRRSAGIKRVGDRGGLAAHARDRRPGRPAARRAAPGRPAPHGTAHRQPADRVRRGLVHRRPGLDRRPAARPRPLAGVTRPSSVLVQSLQRGGAFSQVVLSAGQIMDPDSLLALRVNGADLTPDHGYPARVIVPASPGVHNTKWVASLTFRS